MGAWCFADHMGPADVTEDNGVDVGPHPHIGLHTVTWLLDGEVLHKDTLGSEQVIKPGQLNLMTAGAGVVHAEEATGHFRGTLEGIQLWVAQPEATRHGPAAFEHHAELPRVDIEGGEATVLVGDFAGHVSPARRDTAVVGLDLNLRSSTTLALDPGFEYALIVLRGAVTVAGERVEPGRLAYFPPGPEFLDLAVQDHTRALLLGGEPFESRIEMWWNFVARTRDELTDAYRAWDRPDGRFGDVDSRLNRIPVAPPFWLGG